MPDERGQQYKRSYVAAAVASVSTVVAAVVGYLTNVLTSSWSWTLFAALAALVTVTAVLPFVAEKIEGQRQRQTEEFRLRAEGQAVIARRDRERMAALRSHFQSRAQGLTPSWSRREWYFTGRGRSKRGGSLTPRRQGRKSRTGHHPSKPWRSLRGRNRSS